MRRKSQAYPHKPQTDQAGGITLGEGINTAGVEKTEQSVRRGENNGNVERVDNEKFKRREMSKEAIESGQITSLREQGNIPCSEPSMLEQGSRSGAVEAEVGMNTEERAGPSEATAEPQGTDHTGSVSEPEKSWTGQLDNYCA